MTIAPEIQMPPPDDEKEPRPVGRWLLVLGGAIAIIAAVLMTTQSAQKTQELSEKDGDLKQASAEKLDLAERAIAVCTSATSEQLTKLREVGLCQQAAQIKSVPATEAPPTVPFALVQQAVNAFFAANPVRNGLTPGPEQILPVVRQVFEANKPADGKTPTDQELIALIHQVYAASPPKDGVDGKNGENGKPGQNAFCYDNPDAEQCQPKTGPAGPTGATGPPGPSCPPGWHQEETTSTDGRQMIACFPDGSTPPPSSETGQPQLPLPS